MQAFKHFLLPFVQVRTHKTYRRRPARSGISLYLYCTTFARLCQCLRHILGRLVRSRRFFLERDLLFPVLPIHLVAVVVGKLDQAAQLSLSFGDFAFRFGSFIVGQTHNQLALFVAYIPLQSTLRLLQLIIDGHLFGVVVGRVVRNRFARDIDALYMPAVVME